MEEIKLVFTEVIVSAFSEAEKKFWTFWTISNFEEEFWKNWFQEPELQKKRGSDWNLHDKFKLALLEKGDFNNRDY